MSFSLKISPKDKATGRFKSRVNRDLVKAVIKEKRNKNFTQSQIAERMGVDKSMISRILNGQGNLTLKTIGDICWVLGLQPDVKFSKIQQEDPSRENHPAMREGVGKKPDVSPRSTYSSVTLLTYPQGVAKLQTGSSRSERMIIVDRC